MYLTKIPSIIKPFAKDLVWQIDTDEKIIFLTFDDGPHPVVTQNVLSILDAFNAKATFFCVGTQIEKHTDTFREITEQGHAVGNHTHQHEKGWNSSQLSYLKSFLKCQSLVSSPLFRPPYGRIKRQQAKAIGKRSHIIMWDVLSADFDASCTVEKCVKNVTSNVEPGSIVVFHDSEKASAVMLEALPIILQELGNRGFEFRKLESDIIAT